MRTIKSQINESIYKRDIDVSLKSFNVETPDGDYYDNIDRFQSSAENAMGDYTIILNVKKQDNSRSLQNARVDAASINIDVELNVVMSDRHYDNGSIAVKNIKVNKETNGPGVLNRADVVRIFDYCFEIIDSYPELDLTDPIYEFFDKLKF